MKKILLLLTMCFAFANAQFYYDKHGECRGAYKDSLMYSKLVGLAERFHGPILLKKPVKGVKPRKNLEKIPEDKIQRTFDVNRDTLNKELWLEVEKNEIVRICVDMPVLDFKNEEVLLGFNRYSEKELKMQGFCNTEENGTIPCGPKNEDPERLVKISGQYLVDKYPVTNCEFTQLMWDSIPATSSYQNKSIREDYYETWLSRKRASVRYENCTTHDTAANMVTLFEAMEYANVRSIRDGLRPYYSLTPTDADKESILSKGQYIISYTDFTIHKKNFILVVTDNTSDGYRLPYYEEWMMLARGGDKKNAAPWGDSSGAFEKTLEYARFSTENYSYETEPVGQLKPNGYGLYDMFGLVQEHVLFKYALFDGNIGFSSCLKGGNYHVVLKESDFSLTEHPYWKWINYGYYEPGYPGYGAGFRLIRNIGNNAKWTEVKSDKE